MRAAREAAALARRGAGIGLRAPHWATLDATRPAIGWVEVHTENHLGGGAARHWLDAARALYPVGLHGVGLSLGGAEPLDRHHLDRIARLCDSVRPSLVSEHLAWSRAGERYMNDLLPLPLTREALATVADKVAQVQDRLGRAILVENPSSYVAFAAPEMTEPDLLNALARRTGCGILCDVNNIHVSCANLGGDPAAYLAALDPAAVGELHVAGHQAVDLDAATGQPTRLLIDDHGCAVADPVWSLYAEAVRRFPAAATLVEWDTDLPALPVLVAEAHRADRVRAHALAPSAAGHARRWEDPDVAA